MSANGSVIVEFFGIPRQRAGRAELTVAARSVGEALAAVERACPDLRGLVQKDGRLSPIFLLSVNGRRFVGDLTEALSDGERLLLLSADAGG